MVHRVSVKVSTSSRGSGRRSVGEVKKARAETDTNDDRRRAMAIVYPQPSMVCSISVNKLDAWNPDWWAAYKFVKSGFVKNHLELHKDRGGPRGRKWRPKAECGDVVLADGQIFTNGHSIPDQTDQLHVSRMTKYCIIACCYYRRNRSSASEFACSYPFLSVCLSSVTLMHPA